MKILIIDDDEIIRLSCRNILKRMECTILEAEHGIDGLAQFRKHAPDIVIVDMLMPYKEGLETISEIRAEGGPVKIIAMTSGGLRHNMSFLKLAETLGADRLLKKPLTPESLIGCVQSLEDGQ